MPFLVIKGKKRICVLDQLKNSDCAYQNNTSVCRCNCRKAINYVINNASVYSKTLTI